MARGPAEAAESSQRSPPPPAPAPVSQGRVRSQPDPLLVVCGCFSFLTAVAAILCVSVNVLSAVRSFKNGSDIFDGIFRCYAVVIALLVAVAETEWGFIIKFWRVLEYWAGRGMLQIFVAVMTRAFPDVSGERKDLVLLQDIASYFLLGCGVTYMVSGVLCIGFLKRDRQKKQITREQAAKDLEDGESRSTTLYSNFIDYRDRVFDASNEESYFVYQLIPKIPKFSHGPHRQHMFIPWINCSFVADVWINGVGFQHLDGVLLHLYRLATRRSRVFLNRGELM